jgi:NodT family efflux transporter outer membrane factor (OMF) lipoprotein
VYQRLRDSGIRLLAVVLIALLLSGCTNPIEYIKNCFKVGPNYCPPPAPVSPHWIDAADKRVRSQSQIPCYWWTLFNDPVLNGLIANAYGQNLTLREAGMRVLEARYQRAIAAGELFPQQQDAFGGYQRRGAAGFFANQWNFGFSLAWELDFWGRYRRAVLAADDLLDASVADYDDVLVTLLSDVASNYVILRTDQERIRLLLENITIQRDILNVAEVKFGLVITSVDVEQIRSNLLQNQAQVEQLRIDLRQAAIQLCILLGMPPADLEKQLGAGPIPFAPADLAVGIPADLLRRRPDVRRAERQAAAQAEEIGIAEADLYPAFTINGTLGYQAQEFAQLFTSNAFNGSIGPSFRWNLLNYGRIANNVRFQDARFQELVLAYQNTVLQAQAEVESGLVTFLRAQQRATLLDQSAKAAGKAVKAIQEQLQVGKIDFNQYAVIQQSLIQQQDLWAQARGQIALGLIEIYRAVGGGWEIRLNGGAGAPAMAAAKPAAAPLPPPTKEQIPLPQSQPAPLPPLPPPPQQPQVVPQTP